MRLCRVGLGLARAHGRGLGAGRRGLERVLELHDPARRGHGLVLGVAGAALRLVGHLPRGGDARGALLRRRGGGRGELGRKRRAPGVGLPEPRRERVALARRLGHGPRRGRAARVSLLRAGPGGRGRGLEPRLLGGDAPDFVAQAARDGPGLLELRAERGA